MFIADIKRVVEQISREKGIQREVLIRALEEALKSAARKKLGTEEWVQLIPELEPDWLVLRPGEANSIHKKNQRLLTQTYSLVKTFDVSQQLESYRWIPGRDYLLGDQTFMIFKRNKS